MKKNKINKLVEYFAMTMVLSYFFIHNIFLVLLGITFSVYLINIEFFNRIMRSINKNLVIRKSAKKFNKLDKSKKLDSINKRSNKEDSTLTLVEKVEELGYIPSIDENKKSNAA